LNKGSLAIKLAEIENGSHVIIDGTNAHYIDLDILEIIYNFKETSVDKNINVELVHVPAFKGSFGH
jgi:SulP family sulfate permease